MGTMPVSEAALLFGLRPELVRKWKQRGKLGASCDVRTRVVGVHVRDVGDLARVPSKTRPRTQMTPKERDDALWRTRGLAPRR